MRPFVVPAEAGEKEGSSQVNDDDVLIARVRHRVAAAILVLKDRIPTVDPSWPSYVEKGYRIGWLDALLAATSEIETAVREAVVGTEVVA